MEQLFRLHKTFVLSYNKENVLAIKSPNTFKYFFFHFILRWDNCSTLTKHFFHLKNVLDINLQILLNIILFHRFCLRWRSQNIVWSLILRSFLFFICMYFPTCGLGSPAICTLFAASSPTVFFSHTKPALASSHQPANSTFLSQ